MNPRSMSVPIGPKPPPRGEDLPYDDGMPMETSRHRAQLDLLVDSLDDEWPSGPTWRIDTVRPSTPTAW